MSRVRERIIIIAAPGGGKSTALWSIAKALPSSTCYLVDTEDKHLGLAEAYGGFPANIKYFPVVDWKGFYAAYMSFRDKTRPGDWVMVDNAGDPWHWRIEDFQIDKVLLANKGKTLDELRLTEGITDNDWGEIKRPWNSTIPFTMLRQPGINLALVARAKPFIRITDKKTGVETIKGHGSEMLELVSLDASPDIYTSAIGDVSVVVYLRRQGKLYFTQVLKRPGWTGVDEKINITEPVGFWNGYCENLGLDPKEVPGE